MTTTSSRDRRPLHFPPPGIITDSTGVIVPPSMPDLERFAADVAPKALPEFVKGLMISARRRRYQKRWTAMNRARLELARLCIDRMLDEGLDVPAAAAPVLDLDQTADLDGASRRDLVAEAFHTFGDEAARALADELGVAFGDCAEALERLRHRPH